MIRAAFARRTAWDALGLILRLTLGGVMLVAGLLKAADPIQMEISVRAYQLVPDAVAPAIAATLPYAEIAVGALLLAGLATRLASILSGLLMVAFLIGIISAAARGLNIDCGCFGTGGQVAEGATRYVSEIIRDFALLGAAAFLTVRPRSMLSVDRWAARRADKPDEDGA